MAVAKKVFNARVKQFSELLDRYQAAAAYFDDHYDELLSEYPEEWVAVGADGVVAHSPTRSAFTRKLNRLSPDERSGLYHEFLRKKQRTLIL